MTASLRNTIQELAAGFAAGVLGAIRGSSLEEILAEASGGVRRGPGRPRKNSFGLASAPGGRGAGRSGRGSQGRLGRRSAGALERVVERIVELLSKSSKGLRAEQIRAALGLSAKELPRPIAMALAAKRIRKVGQKRATTYFTGGAGPANPAAGGGKKKAPKRGGRRRAAKAPGAKPRSVAKKPATPAEAPAPAGGS